MGLSCSCDFEWDGEGWCYSGDTAYQPLNRKRAVKCISCGERIAPGAMAMTHHRMRGPASDIEERIHGDEVTIAPHHHCERCADLYLSLTELGYCVSPYEDQRGLVKEYAELKAEEAAAKAHQKWLAEEIKMTGCIDSPITDPIPRGRYHEFFGLS